MNGSRIVPIVAVLALFVACEDQPTAVNQDDLEPQLYQEGKGNFVLWFEIVEEGEYGVVIPCLNDGEGEDVYYYWSGSVWGKDHWTPSGNWLGNVKALFDEDTYMRGLTTGEIWRLERMHETVPQQIKVSDGLLTLWGVLWHRYVNEDGDFVNLREHFQMAYDGPDLVLLDLKLTCAPRK